MTYALMSSGGKDCTLALDRVKRDGLEVPYLVTTYDRDSDRVPFHGTRRELIEAYADRLKLEPLLFPSGGEPFEETFEKLLDEVTSRGITGLVFGNIHLADVRAWYEDRVTAAGLEHVDPIWGEEPSHLIRESVERGFRSIIISVDLAQGAAELLGKEINQELIDQITNMPQLDACGERGEYHSFVFDGPLFSQPVEFDTGSVFESHNHKLLDLIPLVHAKDRSHR